MIKPDSYIPDEKKDKDSDAEKNSEPGESVTE